MTILCLIVRFDRLGRELRNVYVRMKVILEDLRKKRLQQMLLDPRSSSRTPSASAEPPYRPRYDSPLFACEWHICTHIYLLTYVLDSVQATSYTSWYRGHKNVALGLDPTTLSSLQRADLSLNVISLPGCFQIVYYPRESFASRGLCNHRRTFVCLSGCLSVCLSVTTITK